MKLDLESFKERVNCWTNKKIISRCKTLPSKYSLEMQQVLFEEAANRGLIEIVEKEILKKKYEKTEKKTPGTANAYDGIKGWLIVFLLILGINFFVMLAFLTVFSKKIFFNPWFFIGIIVTVFLCISFILIIKKKKFAIFFTEILLFNLLIISLIGSYVYNDLTIGLRGVTANFIWMLYFLKSKRVKATLVN